MIVSKTSLLVVGVTVKDKEIPVLDNVHIKKDGTTIGSGRGVTFAVSPVEEGIKEKLHLEETELDDALTINSEFAKKILKNIPADTHFGGLLEHVDIENSTGSRVDVSLHDGRQGFSINGRKYPDKYTAHEEILQNSLNARNGFRLVVNRSRLQLILDTIAKTCPDSSAETPIFLEFCDNHTILIRCINRVNGQRVMAALLTTSFNEDKWLKDKSWERGLLSHEKTKRNNADSVGSGSNSNNSHYYSRRGNVRSNKRLYKRKVKR